MQNVFQQLCNGSYSKNPDIKTPLVVRFSLRVVIHFSPLAAFWCEGSSNDSHYIIVAIHFAHFHTISIIIYFKIIELWSQCFAYKRIFQFKIVTVLTIESRLSRSTFTWKSKKKLTSRLLSNILSEWISFWLLIWFKN